MKKLLTLLICCLVLTAPVSAYIFTEKDVNADDFVNALVDYCNHNEVRNMTGYDFELSNHDCMISNVNRTNDTLDFKFECKGMYWCFVALIMPFPNAYGFSGWIHVDNPQNGLKRLYMLDITDENRGFSATGKNWVMKAWDMGATRFKY